MRQREKKTLFMHDNKGTSRRWKMFKEINYNRTTSENPVWKVCWRGKTTTFILFIHPPGVTARGFSLHAKFNASHEVNLMENFLLSHLTHHTHAHAVTTPITNEMYHSKVWTAVLFCLSTRINIYATILIIYGDCIAKWGSI